MRTRRHGSLLRFGSLVAFVLALGACTKGGQFDPTTLLDNDMFDSKKPLKGEREPVFPGGVPGVQSGIPQDLYKGYQPPPEQAAEVAPPPPPAPEPAKPKPKPKPKVATTAPPTPRPEITVGLGKPNPPQQQQPAQGGQSPWPDPSPPRSAQGAQSPWPAPPSNGQAQQTGQSSQSIWPDPPATSSH
jgi:outer membrane biosynthesis protein TonB